jgi:hypothetical protein
METNQRRHGLRYAPPVRLEPLYEEMMNQPVNQHWVPQFYLKYFATPDTQQTKNPKTWIFSKDEEDGDPKLTNIRNICAKRFLYSPPDKDGQREWELETRLSDIESLLSVEVSCQ